MFGILKKCYFVSVLIKYTNLNERPTGLNGQLSTIAVKESHICI